MPSTSHHDACAAPSRKPPVARHILHIVADDLGYRDIGYNNAAFSSPHLDRLRACGVHLDQFYAFKTCAPSRSSAASTESMRPRAAMCPKATVGSKEMAARSIAGIENLAVRKN